MADTQQWRRKIQPAKARTAANFAAAKLDIEESDELRPPTPKRRLKPKLSTYFTQPSKPPILGEDRLASELPAWPFDQMYPDPKPEDEMDAIMCHLMAEPYLCLDVHFNASLMRIFEAYLNLRDDNVRLQRRCDEAMATAQTMLAKLKLAEKEWEDQKLDFKDEVKRLEVLLARTSVRGLAEVTLARQDSKLRGKSAGGARKKETIFEFLEKTTKGHGNDTSWSNQRATMKPLLQSSSNPDLNVSRQLGQKKSMTNVHAELPFGTPPARDMRCSLTNISMLDEQADIRRRQRPPTVSNSTDETFSAFSCAGDLLPDESSTCQIHDEHVGEDHDMADIESIAKALARRRGVAPSQVMPQLLDLFGAYTNGTVNYTYSASNALSEQSSSQKVIDSGIVKRATVMTRASGFFQKLKPHVDASASQLAASRRFSFEPGDDIVGKSFASPEQVSGIDGSKNLRRSASLCSMSSRTPSRIPTPVPTYGAMSRPRRERDESMSSLLTVIKRSDDGNSRASSFYSSPSVCRDDFINASPCRDRNSTSEPRAKNSNNLIDHTNGLRGNGSREGRRSAKSSSLQGNINEHSNSLPDINALQENRRPVE